MVARITRREGALEQVRQAIRRYADARVAHFDHQMRVIATRAHLDVATVLRESNGVLHEVDEGLHEPRPVQLRRSEIRGQPGCYPDPAIWGGRAGRGDDLAHESVDVVMLEAQDQGLAVQFGHAGEVRRDVLERNHALERGVHRLLLMGCEGPQGSVAQQLLIAADDRNRRPQFMRGDVDKFALGARRVLERADVFALAPAHGIEARGQRPDLVARCNLEGDIKIASLHRFGAAHQALYRSRDAVSDEQANEQRGDNGKDAEIYEARLDPAQEGCFGIEGALHHVELGRPGLRTPQGTGQRNVLVTRATDLDELGFRIRGNTEGDRGERMQQRGAVGRLRKRAAGNRIAGYECHFAPRQFAHALGQLAADARPQHEGADHAATRKRWRHTHQMVCALLHEHARHGLARQGGAHERLARSSRGGVGAHACQQASLSIGDLEQVGVGQRIEGLRGVPDGGAQLRIGVRAGDRQYRKEPWIPDDDLTGHALRTLRFGEHARQHSRSTAQVLMQSLVDLPRGAAVDGPQRREGERDQRQHREEQDLPTQANAHVRSSATRHTQ